MKDHIRTKFIAGLASVAVMAWPGGAAAAALPTLSDSDQPFSFVVLGDLHYTRPEFATRKIVDAIADSVKDCQPPVAFICHTGDLAEGGTYETKDGKRVFHQASHDETKLELAEGVRDLTERFRRPLFIAVGNHDKHGGGTAFPEVVWPLTARELGAPVTNNCYGFRQGHSVFVFLDFAPTDYQAQQDHIRQLLTQAQAQGGLQHIFLFAHYPLWPLIRPGFSSTRLTESLSPIFKEFPVDAFFCGHTHNTSAWVRRLDGVTFTQIQGVACQASPELIPMETCRTLMLPADQLRYYWGYVSGPAAGHFLVTVDRERVRVQFRAGTKLIRDFEWQAPGQLTDLRKPAPHPPVLATGAELERAAAATLAFCPWAEERAELGIRLNGAPIATTPIGPTMRSNAFVTEQRIAIPPAQLKGLRLANTLTFENPGRAVFGLGHIFLEARLADGRTVRTGVAPRFLFSATAAEGRAAGKQYGWEIIPPAALNATQLGQPLGPLELVFPSAPAP